MGIVDKITHHAPSEGLESVERDGAIQPHVSEKPESDKDLRPVQIERTPPTMDDRPVIDKEIEKRVVRKMDWHLMTLLGALCMCNQCYTKSKC